MPPKSTLQLMTENTKRIMALELENLPPLELIAMYNQSTQAAKNDQTAGEQLYTKMVLIKIREILRDAPHTDVVITITGPVGTKSANIPCSCTNQIGGVPACLAKPNELKYTEINHIIGKTVSQQHYITSTNKAAHAENAARIVKYRNAHNCDMRSNRIIGRD